MINYRAAKVNAYIQCLNPALFDLLIHPYGGSIEGVFNEE